MANKEYDPFRETQTAATDVASFTIQVKEAQGRLKEAKTRLVKHRKAVLEALGRKPRGPRKAKVPALPEKCEHGTKLPGYCQQCQDETQAPNQ
jgi:hypothetical protein